MKYMIKKVVVVLLFSVLLSTVGCKDQTENAKATVQVYLIALSNFNLDTMEDTITEGTNQDMGLDTSIYEINYSQTDTYKQAVDSMYRVLGKTIEFEIHDTEDVGGGVVLVDTTLKCADVNQQAVDEFIQRKMDEYVVSHPGFEQKTEIDQNNIAIRIMAEAYKEFVQLQPKVSQNIKIAVTEINGQWRVVNGDANRELKQWIGNIFGAY